MFPMRTLSFAAIVSLSAVAAAQAGGYTAPTPDAEVTAPAPVVTAPAANWQGGYVGAALGYSFNGDDRIGMRDPATGIMTNIGNAKVNGPNLSLRAGYLMQRDRWVFGPEVTYSAGDVKDEFDYAGGTFESKVNNQLSLRLRTGYLVRDDMMVYGIAGVSKGDFTYTENGEDVDYDANGYVMGLGVEKKITSRVSVTGELEHANYHRTEVTTPSGIITKATPEHSTAKLGLNFKF